MLLLKAIFKQKGKHPIKVEINHSFLKRRSLVMDIREFDRLIMGGTYRLISDKSKAPINNYLYGIDEALLCIVADGRPLRLGWMVSDDYIVNRCW